MSILIKDMEMPKDCQFCALSYEDEDTEIYCNALHRYVCDAGKECPLVEVSEPHGRLIDADNIKGIINLKGTIQYSPNIKLTELIDAMPTVIEAEEREHE